MSQVSHILVTGAGGGVGGVGRSVVNLLREQGLPVRAFVHHDDERADTLRALGADVFVGDLGRPSDVAEALDGCRRMFFGMSVSPSYLEAATTVATVARATAELEVLVNISQLTVSQMTAVSANESHHQRLHWLAERVLDWSTLPVVQIRPTVFLENPFFTTLIARSVAEDGVIRLPFGAGRTSPVAAADVARVIAAVLQDPGPHVGQVYELTGPRAQSLDGVAEQYSRALNKPVRYLDVPLQEWTRQVLSAAGLPDHLEQHLSTMARLHHENRYDRLTHTVEQLTGRPAQSVEAFVAARAEQFTAQAPGRRARAGAERARPAS
jgi:uncharacterized protein YbjT (DUF2867 family)